MPIAYKLSFFADDIEAPKIEIMATPSPILPGIPTSTPLIML